MKTQLPRRSMHPLVLVFALVSAFGSAFGCGGGGCGCMAPIPGGFPSAERTDNAAQIRVTDTGIEAITDDPAALVSGLTGGPLTFDVPEDCNGFPSTCCPGGVPQTPCGPIEIDLTEQAGDEPRLEITPVQGASHLDVVLRARVTTAMSVPVGLFGADCTLDIDTAPGADPDIRVDVPIDLVQDATSGTTRVEVGQVDLTQLTAEDVTLGGGIFCTFAGFGLSFFIDTIAGTFEDAISSAVSDQLCKACPSGDVSECGEFADSCTDNVCMRADDTCVQELGITGRMAGSAIFGALSPGTTGSIDIYEVAGEYADTDSGGISLGLLGGMLPSGTEHDRCGPPATAPAAVTIPESDFFKGNTRPDNDAAFDVGIGVHQSQLDEFAYSAYDGGLFCLTIGTSTVDLLTSETIGLFIPSLANLTGRPSPMYLGLRPQSPPVIVLGTNTFIDDGAGNVTLDDPLLDITFTDLEMDFFVGVEDQYIRIMTIVADVHLPLGLQVGDGEITPVLGDLEAAFTDLTVKNNEVLLESAEELADVFPTLLDLALPQIAGGLGGFAVPELAGLQLNITDITAVDNATFLAIFAELAPAAKRTERVETVAQLVDVRHGGTDVMTEPTKWSKATRPQIDVAFGGEGLEWQTRIDDGLWSAWSTSKARTLSQDRLWLEGKHVVDVRARRVGQPFSMDQSPVRLDAIIDTIAPVVELAWDPAGVKISATDNVAAPLTGRWRFADGAWTDVELPAIVPHHGAWDDLEIEVYDAVGNMSPARGVSMAPAPFHGQPSQTGCGCQSSEGGESTGVLVLVIGGVFAIGRRRLREYRKLLLAVAFVVVAASMPACDCGGNPCGDVACLPGEVAMGTIGRYNGIASDGDRTVVSTYDDTLGDLVLVDVIDGEPVYQAVDGVPDDIPSYDPSTYRGGRVNQGPDVGAWSSVALHEGLARIASQDRDAGDLRIAIEQDGSDWVTYSVDAQETVVTGTHASIAIDGTGAPAVAYLAEGVIADDGSVVTELRLARAASADPSDADWTITKIAEAVGSCAGRCGGGAFTCVEPAADGEPEVCAQDSGDCAAACADGETCVAGACRANVADPTSAALPEGTGLFVNLVTLPSGALAAVYYDRARSALVAQVESAAGTSQFTEFVLDGGDDADRGLWASAAVGANGTIHVVYQDGRTDQVFYTTLASAPGPIELVDDGLRAPDRPHNVGAGAAVFVSGTTPAVIYQDGFSSDLVKATRSTSGTWSHADFATGAGLVDGFYLAATPDGTYLAWDSMDKNASPATSLEIREDP